MQTQGPMGKCSMRLCLGTSLEHSSSVSKVGVVSSPLLLTLFPVSLPLCSLCAPSIPPLSALHPRLPPPPPPDETSGEINRNPTEQIDRERMAQYNLDVVARDDGDPELNATVLVRIDILVSVGV